MSESSESERDSTPQKAEIEEAQEASFNKKETHEESTPRKADILVDEPSRREETPPPEEELSDHNSGKHPKDPLFSKYGPDKRLVLPDVNKSMMLPTMVRPHKFGKNPNAESQLASGRVGSHRRVVSTSQTRQKLATTSLKHRVAFNANFTSKNSMAKRYFAQNLAQKVQNDFDPNTVYDGIEAIEFELDDLEEKLENLDQPDFDDYMNENLDEQIEVLLEHNRQLMKKVHAVAEVVAKGVSKAAHLKNQKMLPSHREHPEDNSLRKRKIKLNKLHKQVVTEKRKIESLENDISIINSSNVVGQEEFRNMKDQHRLLAKEVRDLQKQAHLLRGQNKELRTIKKRQSNQGRVEAKEHQLKLDIKHFQYQKAELDKDLTKVQGKHNAYGVQLSTLQDQIKELKNSKHMIQVGKLKPKDIEPEPDEQIVEIEQRGEVVNNILAVRDRLHDHQMNQKKAKVDKVMKEIEFYKEEIDKMNTENLVLANEMKAIKEMAASMKLKKKQQTRNDASISAGVKTSVAVEAGTQSQL